MSENNFCSTCQTDKHISATKNSDVFEVKGENIPFSYEVLVCENCGEYISTPDKNDDILKGVYDTYKKKHGLLLTEEIIKLRENFKLSLRDFSRILGVSYITYHRYEKGAIPDP